MLTPEANMDYIRYQRQAERISDLEEQVQELEMRDVDRFLQREGDKIVVRKRRD